MLVRLTSTSQAQACTIFYFYLFVCVYIYCVYIRMERERHIYIYRERAESRLSGKSWKTGSLLTSAWQDLKGQQNCSIFIHKTDVHISSNDSTQPTYKCCQRSLCECGLEVLERLCRKMWDLDFKCWKRIRCQLFSLWREFYLFIYSVLVLISVKNKFSLHPLHCKNTWKKKWCSAITFCWYRCLTAELGPLGLEKLKEMLEKRKKHSWRFVGNTWQATDLHLLKKKKKKVSLHQGRWTNKKKKKTIIGWLLGI